MSTSPRTPQPLTPEQRRLVEANRKFAYAVVRKIVNRLPDTYRLLDDLNQTAFEELCLASVEFDPRRKVQFSTYAWARMDNRVKYEAAKISGVVDRPRTWRDDKGRKRTDLVTWGWADKDVYDPTFGLVGDAAPGHDAQERELAGHVYDQTRSEVLRRVASGPSRYPDRDTDVFVRVRVDGQRRKEAAGAWGISLVRVDQILAAVQRHFDSWAAEVRAEHEPVTLQEAA